MEGYIAIALLILVLQLIFSVHQLRKYDRFIQQLVEKYNVKGYSLYSETAKKIFSTVVVVIVTDENNKVVEAYEYKGLTIFARFYLIDEIIGRKLNKDFYREMEQKEDNLTLEAIIKIIERNNTHVI